MDISLKSIKDSLLQTPAMEAVSEKAILARHVSKVNYLTSFMMYLFLVVDITYSIQ